jgi:thiol-disulfide isomerase/thioredoxin
MKRIKFSSIALQTVYVIILLLSVIACQHKDTSTILTGKILGYENDSLTLVNIQDYIPGFECENIIAVDQADSTGYFSFKIHDLEPGFYQVLFSNYHRLNYELYLEPGDSVYIEQAYWQDPHKLILEGKGAEKLSFLVSDYDLFPKGKDFYDTIRSKGFETEMDFKHFMDSIFQIRINLLASNDSIPEILRTYYTNSIKAEHADFLLNHLERRNYYMKDEFGYYFPDSSYYSFLDSLNFDNDFCKTVKSRLLAESYLNDVVKTAFKGKKEEESWKKSLSWTFNYITEQENSLWKDYLAMSTIRDFSFGLALNDFFESLEAFDAKAELIFYDELNKKAFQESAGEYRRLKPGNPAPAFALPDSSGHIVHLNDFIGSIVYIDFWGTWCYPCIQEIPDALELQKKYQDQPVVFLYVALEYQEEEIAHWKKFIAGKDEMFGNYLNHQPFPGVHLVADKQFRNPEIAAYKINFAPTHVLIDQYGKIVSARADRSASIAEKIDELLLEME